MILPRVSADSSTAQTAGAMGNAGVKGAGIEPARAGLDVDAMLSEWECMPCKVRPFVLSSSEQRFAVPSAVSRPRPGRWSRRV